MTTPTIPRPRLLLALAAALGACTVLAGCIGFKGPITVAQQDVVGKVRVAFTVCATGSSGCGPSNDSSGSPGDTDQVLVAFRVFAGTAVPDSFSSVSGQPMTMARSASYTSELTRLLPPAAGEQWVGYISTPFFYSGPPDDAGFVVDLGLPPGDHGRPFPGPFPVRPVVGGRNSNNAGDGTSTAGRPVTCGEDPFSPSTSNDTICVDAPSPEETAKDLSAETRDLTIGGTQVAADPSNLVTVPFAAHYRGAAGPTFELSARSVFRRTPVMPSRTTLAPDGDSSTPVGLSLRVPRRAAPGLYLVVLEARLPNGQKREGIGAIRVRDRLGPVARGFAVSPKSFVPLASGGSIAAARGARVSYTLSEDATTRFTVQRRVCRRRGECRFRRVRGSFRHKGKKGANRFRFTGRLRRRALAPGRYRLVGVPVDAARNRGRQVRVRFRILR